MKRLLVLLAMLVALTGGAFAAQSPININTATVEELDALKGIGPVKAKAIVDYRTKNGPFRALEDIKNVDGIGDATFNQIKGDITIGRVAAAKGADKAADKGSAKAAQAKAAAKEEAPVAAKGEKGAKGEAPKAEKGAKGDAPKADKGDKGGKGAPREDDGKAAKGSKEAPK